MRRAQRSVLSGVCLGTAGERHWDAAGTLGQCQGLSIILFLSWCAHPSPAFLSICSSPSFPAGLWDCFHLPQLLESARTTACPVYACTGWAQLSVVPGSSAFNKKTSLHPHPHCCIIILTPAPSSSSLHSTHSSSVQPRCTAASLTLP